MDFQQPSLHLRAVPDSTGTPALMGDPATLLWGESCVGPSQLGPTIDNIRVPILGTYSLFQQHQLGVPLLQS